MIAVILDWRSRFATPWAGTPHELVFLFVGLPAYVQDLPSIPYDGKTDDSLPLLRLSQSVASETLNHTAMSSLIDHGYLFGWHGSIHPMDKTPVGKRLLLSAREHAYAEPGVVSTGPVPSSAAAVFATPTTQAAAAQAGDHGGAGGVITLSFDQATVGRGGLLLRTSGDVRQKCPLGQKQISGNPTKATVPLSQCGPGAFACPP